MALVSACAGKLVTVRSASTVAWGPALGFTIAYVLSAMGPDHARPDTFAPVRYFLVGAVPSAAPAAYS
ncbi:MAG: hypothetical protein E6I13_01090 [Chloroflexi bacterium]|nr:MAG: hypothetical protein E6I13_01090 [Chloroflexota bacterium]